MIRVALDAQIARESCAGIGSFTAALEHWLPIVDHDAHYSALVPRRSAPLNMPERWWWDQVSVPRLARGTRADVLLKPAFSVPVFSRIPTVAVLHDLAVKRFPHDVHRPSAWFYGTWAPWTLHRAVHVIAVSEFTKREAVALLHIPEDHITVVYQGYEEQDWITSDLRDRTAVEDLPEQYLLHVGTIEPRKNLPFLMEVFREFLSTHPDYHLLLAGSSGWLNSDAREAVRRFGLERNVRFLGLVSNQVKRALYEDAQALVFPSKYEGFGRPPLEAMAIGTPVVAAENSAIPEVVGDAGILVQGYTVGDWASAISRVTDNPSLRNNLKERGLARSRVFSSQSAAQRVASILHHVVHQ